MLACSAALPIRLAQHRSSGSGIASPQGFGSQPPSSTSRLKQGGRRSAGSASPCPVTCGPFGPDRQEMWGSTHSESSAILPGPLLGSRSAIRTRVPKTSKMFDVQDVFDTGLISQASRKLKSWPWLQIEFGKLYLVFEKDVAVGSFRSSDEHRATAPGSKV